MDTTITTRQLQIGEEVRRLRTGLGLSVRTLAARAEFSPSFISQVEHGQVSPSIASLERIAAVLGVTIAGLLAPATEKLDAITRAGDRRRLASSWSKARIEDLGASGRLEAVIITIAPGGRSGKTPTSHAGEELGIVFEGDVSFTLGEDVHRLKRGDSVSFSSETPHLWENHGPEAAQIAIVSPRFTH
ncbi:MAG: cupin domain-containing protein [Dehalococcoidia bacterium]